MNNNAKGANAQGNKGFKASAKQGKNLNDSIVLDYAGEISKTFFGTKEIIDPAHVSRFTTEEAIQNVIDEQVKHNMEFLEYYMANPDGVRNMAIMFLYTYQQLKKMWESDSAKHNFVKHLFISFCDNNNCTISPVSTKADTTKPFCCITNMMAISRAEVDRINEQFITAHDKWQSENPGKPVPSKLFKYAWVISNADIVGMYSLKSDKTISYTAYRALSKLFRELGEQDDKEVMTIVQHFIRENRHENFMTSLNDETREEYRKTKEAENKHKVQKLQYNTSETLENVSGADKLRALREKLEQEQ